MPCIPYPETYEGYGFTWWYFHCPTSRTPSILAFSYRLVGIGACRLARDPLVEVVVIIDKDGIVCEVVDVDKRLWVVDQLRSRTGSDSRVPRL